MADNRHAARFILLTIFLDALGFGLVVPVVPHLVASLAGGDAAAGSAAFGVMQAAYAGATFVCAPLLGRLSDRFGRRPVLLLAMAGAAIDHLVAALAGSIGLLIAARFFAGVCGASSAAATAYVADSASPENRGRAFAIAGTVFGIGFVSGPALGGFLGEFGPRVPFYVAAALTGLNALYGLLVLPESLPAERRRPLDLGALNPLGGVLSWWRHPLIGGLMAVVFLFMLAHSGIQASWVLFTDVQLGWGPREVGLSLGALGIVAIIAQAGMAPLLIRRLGPGRALMAGIAGMSLFCFALAFAAAGWQVYAALSLLLVAMAAGPAAQALVANAVRENEQGLLQGTISGVTGLAAVFGPLIGTWTFAHFIGPAAPVHFPGAAFLLAGVLGLIGLGLAALALRRSA
ncbi:MFS transporter [Zavarzinia compransoris]|uniref:Tetracycline resistance MFS efflux pump n=1 Tax=Zavarzinia compransoris TaxID=1264899 RepID=A0A317E5T3_9PROT|nr:MFS transporter [Zavarzinia compransoris]PWR22031.1 tetracycline resistance MFS efflux pump [Zavarzinia compransoris]TDP47228.1 DHA1 family tetracycline resistance protein-like MFS transporter [Zavarzinia compransoris]